VEGPTEKPVHVMGEGFKVQYYKGTEFKGEPIVERIEPEIQFNLNGTSPCPGVPADKFSAIWRGQIKAPVSGTYTFSFSGDDGYRVSLAGEAIIERWKSGSAERKKAMVDMEAGKVYDVMIEYFQGIYGAVAEFNWTRPDTFVYGDVIAAAKAADVVVVCVGTDGTEKEGHDRPSMDLPLRQDELIRAAASANPNTVVVLNNGTPVTMANWLDQVPAVIEAWFPGQEGGTALAEILFGDVNPSGKLTTTLATAREDYPDYGNFPGTEGVVNYEEGIYVGYRHFDKQGIAPIFPFGHGLSYTTFEYSNLKQSRTISGNFQVSVDVSNTGKRAGEEVVQLYVHDPKPKVDKPVRELKGFAKVALESGAAKTVVLELTPRDLAYFDVKGKQWKADAGSYQVELGASSRDLRLKTVLRLNKTYTESVPLSRQF
jgi:beta-glucosidase